MTFARLGLGRLLTHGGVLCGLLIFPQQRTYAQEVPTESKALDLAAFGAYTNVNPDSDLSKRNNGLSFGADFTRYISHYIVAPSLEVRANFASGARVDERSYLAGVRVQVNATRHIYPYGDFQIGYGTIHYFVPPQAGYTEDNAAPKFFGGGVDFDVTRHFQGRIDYQSESWNFDGKNSISPTSLLIGMRYVIPFRPYVSKH